jgi:hypothetical protein
VNDRQLRPNSIGGSSEHSGTAATTTQNRHEIIPSSDPSWPRRELAPTGQALTIPPSSIRPDDVRTCLQLRTCGSRRITSSCALTETSPVAACRGALRRSWAGRYLSAGGYLRRGGRDYGYGVAHWPSFDSAVSDPAFHGRYRARSGDVVSPVGRATVGTCTSGCAVGTTAWPRHNR